MIDIEKLRKKAIKDIKKVLDEEGLKSLKLEYLGRSGKLTALLKDIKNLPVDRRASVGKKANMLRQKLDFLIKEKMDSLKKSGDADSMKKEWIDITLPGKKISYGHIHPITKIRREVEEIFTSMGFEIVEGPEVETERYNFDALNIPEDHPAREMWDTFWIKDPKGGRLKVENRKWKKNNYTQRSTPNYLLRTHTSPAQIHYMDKHQPPFRIIAPGKVFRYEATDASHDIEFYQFEGLVVGKDINVANFKYIITEFFKKIFGHDVKIRLRPSFFPFVEPGFEVDMTCIQCSGKGCSVCSRTGWLEMMGAGMVHPNVFKAVGYNPKLWQGFAFGVGLDRIAMMKYKIPDIRFFHQNDIRFLKQF